MSKSYYMPTKLIMGADCIIENYELFKAYGKKAMIVTGRSSAKINGSQEDVVKALDLAGITYEIYDKVMPNPTVECVLEGAEVIKAFGADFLIGIGGGSPIDAAKAMALAVGSSLTKETIYSRNYTEALPLIAVPTTAGTGTEVTPYAVLTNHAAKTKKSVSSPMSFPVISFMDPKYMMSLPKTITTNTVIDALSHAVEGMMSVKKSLVSDMNAAKSIGMITSLFPRMIEVTEDQNATYSLKDREAFLYASMYAGIVISQTATTIVHAMGYPLTYFHNIDHGRANGLLLTQYMRFVSRTKPATIEAIVEASAYDNLEEMERSIYRLLGSIESISEEEIKQYSSVAVKTGNTGICIVPPSEEEIVGIYKAVFK